ncbi:MAG: polymerase sigma factor RpoE [Labilithrix sp.]|nr:polymerase sigma factor RpoE [Labilithrix sp.]
MSAAYQVVDEVVELDIEPDPEDLETSGILPAPSLASAPPPAPESGVSTRDLSPESQARAFRALYDAHVAFVWRNLRRLGVMDRDVEDKCQEVFVVAHRRWIEFADRGHGPRAWLFQIVVRVAADARRHRRRHPIDPDGGCAGERVSIEPPQAEALARSEALAMLDRALASIEMGRRAVLVLHEIEQMTAPEVARTLEIPLNTVYSRLRVARVELEAELARVRESTPPPAAPRRGAPR